MADRREVTLEIAVTVNAATSLDEIIQVVMRRLGDLVHFDRSSIALLDTESNTLELREIALNDPDSGNPEERGKRVPVDESNALGWAVAHRKPHVRSHLQDGREFQAQQDGAEMVSHVIAPLIARREVLGLLNIGSRTVAAFGEEDVALVCQ